MDLEHIQSKIYEIRGVKVMLDYDSAETYGIETKYLKRAVRHNIKRFEGDDFMFELTKDEFEVQILHLKKRGGTRYMPFAFTELGVAMLSSVLNSETAIDINRKIMRAFVAVRHLIINEPVNEVKELQKEVRELKEYIEEVFSDYNDINEDTRMQFELVNEALAKLQAKNKWIDRPRNPIGFLSGKE